MRALVARPIAPLAVLLALALAACGGDGPAEEGSTSPPAQDAGQGGGVAAGGADLGATGAGGGEGVDLRVRPASIPAARVTRSGAVQTLPPSTEAQRTAQENSYASIKAFGAEAEGEEATSITFALVQYLTAKAEGDWATACARLYSVLRESVEREAGADCPRAFGGLMARSPQSSRDEQARIDVSAVRRGEGDRAFVVYKTPATLSADMPMYVEDGVWKVGAIEAYALRPEQVG